MSSYTADFYLGHRSVAERSAQRLVPLINQLFQPTTVLDVGCGDGTWLMEWSRHGIADFTGVDGIHVLPALLRIPSENFLPRDLSKAFDLGRKFDLVMSLEVAEHLDAGVARTFVESLTRHSDLVVFSAAVPGQFGTNHVNEQWPSYWAGLFEEQGLRVFDILRTQIWNDPEIAWWYRQNILVFCTTKRARQYPGLSTREGCPPSPLEVAHPEFMRYFRDSLRSDASVRLLVGKIVRLLRRRFANARGRWGLR